MILANGWPMEDLVTGAEVARLLRVHPATVKRWANQSRLVFTRTVGGHRRYSAKQIEALLLNEFDSRLPNQRPPVRTLQRWAKERTRT